MEFISTPLKDLWVVKTKIYPDTRGYFFEAYKEESFRAKGLCSSWAQDNFSLSKKGAVRGHHLQRAPHAQIKLVRVVSGRAFEVTVDMRAGSATYGKHYSLELNSENALALYVPEGFTHGFQSLEEGTILTYKCSSPYFPQAENGVRWDDPDLNVAWPLKAQAICSPKDVILPFLKDFKE